MNFFETLLHPDREEAENAERAEVGKAANILQVGEFQLLQLAYADWYGKDLPVAMVDRLFAAYMVNGEVPPWARHYARKILRLDGDGLINGTSPNYHRYDHDYVTAVPNGVRQFIMAVACIVFFIGGGILVASMAVDNPASMFPPYIEVDDLPRTAPAEGGWNAPANEDPHPGGEAEVRRV